MIISVYLNLIAPYETCVRCAGHLASFCGAAAVAAVDLYGRVKEKSMAAGYGN